MSELFSQMDMDPPPGSAHVILQITNNLSYLQYTSMGAGIVKPEPNGGIRIHIHTGGSQHVHTAENHTANSTSSSTSSNRRQSPTSNCEDCATSFSTFKRKVHIGLDKQKFSA